MADTYSKGTRVWFPDKELGWISAEVTAVIKSADGSVKLTFIDDRGKVCMKHSARLVFPRLKDNCYVSQEIVIGTTIKAVQQGSDQLPPLRNPPLLETCEDLATLSHLNEPSGNFSLQQELRVS